MKTIGNMWGWALFLALAGCSSSQPTASEAPAEASTEPPETHATSAPASQTATATATASAAPPPKMSGAPALKLSGAMKVSAPAGSGAAKFEIGKDHSQLAIPE